LTEQVLLPGGEIQEAQLLGIGCQRLDGEGATAVGNDGAAALHGLFQLLLAGTGIDGFLANGLSMRRASPRSERQSRSSGKEHGGGPRSTGRRPRPGHSRPNLPVIAFRHLDTSSKLEKSS